MSRPGPDPGGYTLTGVKRLAQADPGGFALTGVKRLAQADPGGFALTGVKRLAQADPGGFTPPVNQFPGYHGAPAPSRPRPRGPPGRGGAGVLRGRRGSL